MEIAKIFDAAKGVIKDVKKVAWDIEHSRLNETQRVIVDDAAGLVKESPGSWELKERTVPRSLGAAESAYTLICKNGDEYKVARITRSNPGIFGDGGDVYSLEVKAAAQQEFTAVTKSRILAGQLFQELRDHTQQSALKLFGQAALPKVAKEDVSTV